jgi:hypothetical protein
MTLDRGIDLLIREFGMENDRIVRVLIAVERDRKVLENMSEAWLDRWYNRVREHLSENPEE